MVSFTKYVGLVATTFATVQAATYNVKLDYEQYVDVFYHFKSGGVSVEAVSEGLKVTAPDCEALQSGMIVVSKDGSKNNILVTWNQYGVFHLQHEGADLTWNEVSPQTCGTPSGSSSMAYSSTVSQSSAISAPPDYTLSASTYTTTVNGLETQYVTYCPISTAYSTQTYTSTAPGGAATTLTVVSPTAEIVVSRYTQTITQTLTLCEKKDACTATTVSVGETYTDVKLTRTVESAPVSTISSTYGSSAVAPLHTESKPGFSLSASVYTTTIDGSVTEYTTYCPVSTIYNTAVFTSNRPEGPTTIQVTSPISEVVVSKSLSTLTKTVTLCPESKACVVTPTITNSHVEVTVTRPIETPAPTSEEDTTTTIESIIYITLTDDSGTSVVSIPKTALSTISQATTPAPEAPKSSAPAPEAPKTTAPAPEAPKFSAPAPETPKSSAPAPEAPKSSAPAPEAPKSSAPAPEAPKSSAPAPEAPKTTAPAPEAPKTSAPAPEAPKSSAPAPEAPKTTAPAPEAPKSSAPAPEAPKSSAPAPETPKSAPAPEAPKSTASAPAPVPTVQTQASSTPEPTVTVPVPEPFEGAAARRSVGALALAGAIVAALL